MEELDVIAQRRKKMEIGETIIEKSAFLGIVVPEKKLYDRYLFLKHFTEQAYFFEVIQNKLAYHINYWYEGPCGNVGLNLFETGDYKRLRQGVVAFSRLNIAESDEMLEIAKKMIETLIRNRNIVLFLPTEEEVNIGDNAYIEYYHCLFPEAIILRE